MSDFTFTATAECDYCGGLLSSSDEDCDSCSESDIHQQMFRRISSDEDNPETLAVMATHDYKWYKLEREVGDDWIAYEWLGPRESVQNMIGLHMWETIHDIPKRAMSLDAPNDVGEQ